MKISLATIFFLSAALPTAFAIKGSAENKQLRGRQSKQAHNLDSHGIIIKLKRNMQSVPTSQGEDEKAADKAVKEGKEKSKRSIKCRSRGKVNSQEFSVADYSYDGCFAVNDVAVTTKNTAVVLPDVLANDIQVAGSTLVMESHTAPENGVLVEDENGVFTYTPNPDFVGVDTYEYTALDGLGGLHTGLVTITVNNVEPLPSTSAPVSSAPTSSAPTTSPPTPSPNRPPLAFSKGIDLLIGTERKIGVSSFAADPDGDIINIDSCTEPSFGSIEVTNDEITYVPDLNFTGQDLIVCTVSDGKGGVDTSTLTFEVLEFTPGDPLLIVRKNTPLTQGAPGLLGKSTGIETGQLVLEDCTEPNLGSLTFDSDGFYTYTPDVDVSGSDVITCNYSNGNGLVKIFTTTFFIQN